MRKVINFLSFTIAITITICGENSNNYTCEVILQEKDVKYDPILYDYSQKIPLSIDFSSFSDEEKEIIKTIQDEYFFDD